jgi:hypothetical protein
MIPPRALLGVESAARTPPGEPPMPTPLELRLHQLSLAFARRVAGIVSGLTIEELAALCGEDGVPVAKAPRKKARPTPKARPATKARPKARRKSARSALPVKTKRPASTPITEAIEPVPEAPPSFRVVPQPEDRAAAFRRAEPERLESAVLKFVSQNPETDAEIVSQRVGLPKGKAQGLLDDLVLGGRLRMKSGQHGRCYVGVETG